MGDPKILFVDRTICEYLNPEEIVHTPLGIPRHWLPCTGPVLLRIVQAAFGN